MKTAKAIFLILLFTYAIMFACDYVAGRRAASPEFCQKWFKSIPWWGHLLMPGAGNACIDKGFKP